MLNNLCLITISMVNRYDLKDTSKIYIEDLLLLTSMGPPGGSRQDVYARFLRHFDIFAINSFSNESMTRIFSTLLFIGLKVEILLDDYVCY